MVYLAHHCRFDCVDAIQIMVKLNVMCTVKQKVKQSRANNFASFREKKFLQIVISQRRIFYINLADNADLDLLLFPAIYLIESLDNLYHQRRNFFPSKQFLAEKLLSHLYAVIYSLLALSRDVFIWYALIIQCHDQIAAQDAIDRLQKHGNWKRESSRLFTFQKAC